MLTLKIGFAKSCFVLLLTQFVIILQLCSLLLQYAYLTEFLIKLYDDINAMLCPIKVDSNTIEPIVHTFCYWVLDLLCVTINFVCIK